MAISSAIPPVRSGGRPCSPPTHRLLTAIRASSWPTTFSPISLVGSRLQAKKAWCNQDIMLISFRHHSYLMNDYEDKFNWNSSTHLWCSVAKWSTFWLHDKINQISPINVATWSTEEKTFDMQALVILNEAGRVYCWMQNRKNILTNWVRPGRKHLNRYTVKQTIWPYKWKINLIHFM